MEYREAIESDIAGIMVLYKQLDSSSGIFDSIKATTIWKQILENNSIRYFVAVEDRIIISTCSIIIIPNLTKSVRPYALIENVITDIDHRKKGIGKKVINMAIMYAKQNDCYKVQLLSGITRIDAHLFYEKIGFSGNTKKGFEIRFPK
jgi:GNAT superfamily N-acetyltransferase